MSAPLLSVIIPVYNVEPYIKECLDSVVNQTYTNLEIILVDDGSPDGCGKICDEYARKDLRVKVIHQKNSGVSMARNAGLDIAEGEWVAFVDPDDWIELDTYSLCMDKALSTGVDVIFFLKDSFQNDSYFPVKKYSEFSREQLFADIPSEESFLFYCLLSYSMCNMIIRKKMLTPSMRFDPDLSLNEDGYLKIRLYPYLNSFFYIDRVLYHYRQREESASHENFNIVFGKLKKWRKMFLDLFDGNLYPQNARSVTNSIFISHTVYGIIETLIPQKDISFKEKRRIIRNTVYSSEFQEAEEQFEPRAATRRSITVFFKLRRFPLLAAYVVYAIRKIRCRRLKGRKPIAALSMSIR